MNWEAVIRQARDCHTKQAWEALFAEFGEALASSNNSKPIQEIFRLLRDDPQCLQYNPEIFGILIRGCLASWNLELGREIADFAQKIPSVAISLPSAQVLLESGQPVLARAVAGRALRLTGLTSAEKLQLEMLICSSYAEEGKHSKAIRILTRIAPAVRSPGLSDKERADFLQRMGRMQFFLGRYEEAGELFYDASKSYRRLGDWESAAKSLFNTAASIHNSGSDQKDRAYGMVEECRKLSEEHDLPGPLSHCEAFYGLDAYHHGDLAAAREHFRLALEFLPISDKSYRRLHILSMLSLVYLAMGRYHLARKFGRQTLDLAALDESERNRIRYRTLEAELQWEDGLIEESQKLLAELTEPLEARGVQTLEELSTLNRYHLQLALAGEKQVTCKHQIAEQLKRHTFNCLDREHALGQLDMNRGDHESAEQRFDLVYQAAKESGDRLHLAMALLGRLQVRLKTRRVEDLDELQREFEIAVARLGETPLRTHVQFVRAASAYQLGDFQECERVLRLVAKGTRQSFPDKFVLAGWIATIEGRSPRLVAPWQIQMMARYTRTYFAPSLEAVDDRHFRVSRHYLVSLERHQSLAELLHYLILRSDYSASVPDIQTHVWRQSLQTQGWQQKIRNTIMRLRDFFPQTIAPLILHSDEVRLYKEAIQVQPLRREGLNTNEEVLRLLKDAPMSSTQLSRRLHISTATTKRILKRLASENAIQTIREGRNVYYRA